jgi:hypothetical protein
MVLEGTGTIYPRGHPEKAVTVQGGEMVIVTEDGQMTQPEQFDVKLILETSLLILDFPPLANLPLILQVVNQQLAEQQLFGTTGQPLARDLIDLIDVTDLNANSNSILLAIRTGTPTPTPPPPITPTPTPEKFGTPSTITAPNPYVITSGTVITTDPSITTNGVTNFGKIYRGSADDGAFTLWAFGSTSAVDIALDFDTRFQDAGHFPAAAFKFTSLVLAGNPAIDLSNSGVANLALISIGDITSGLPGGTLTFSGLDALFLASQDGSINLGSEITFQDLPTLFFYARGTNGDLTLASQIVGTTDLFLYAGRNITFNAGTDLTLGGDFSTRTAGGTISVIEAGDVSIGGSLSASTDVIANAATGGNITFTTGGSFSASDVVVETTVDPGVTLTNGANITLDTGTDLTVGGGDLLLTVDDSIGGHIGTGGNISLTTGGLTTQGDTFFTVQNTNGTIDNGGKITLMVDGSVSTQGQLSLLVENFDETTSPAGHIGTGGNISLTTGGDLTADFASIAINNRAGGVIDSGVDLTITIGGALSTVENGPDFLGNSESLSLAISNRFDNNTAGSFIGGDAILSFQSDSALIGGPLGGFLSVLISDRGGTIDGNAVLNFNVTHDITVQDNATWQILNDSGDALHADSPIGGMIHGDATLLLTATNLNVTAGSLNVDILNENFGVVGSGGTIDSDTTITFTLTGDLTTPQGAASFSILNEVEPGGTTGGTIGGNATININVANIFTGVGAFGSSLDALINNATGNIGADATVNVDVTGAITAQGPANFQILNNDGGHIGGEANIFVMTGGDLTASSILGFVNNRNGGSIDSGSNITFNVGGALTTTGDATFGVSNRNDGSGGGTIGSNVLVSLMADSVSVGGFFDTFISTNGGGHILGDAINTVSVTGDVSAQSGILVSIEDTIFGGTGNFTGGQIDGNAVLTLSAQNITTPSTASGVPGIDLMAIEASIYPNTGGTVGGDAIVDVSASQTISALGSVLFWVANGNYLGLGPGTIGGAATVDVSASNISTGDLFTQIQNYDGASIGGAAMISVNTNTMSVGGNLDAVINNSGGSIGGSANMNFNLTGDLTTSGDADFQIFNSDFFGDGGTITSDATITINAANITANSLLADIDNTGGSIGGAATINMNVSGTATVTTDATVQILGSDGAVGGAAINFNGGSYDAGGTFLAFIDQSGTITFNNATAHADVLKVGALGTSGVLNIGGGMLSADTTLELYASGSNGQLNFVSNVTLGGNSVKILAANSITIFDNIVVTIGGSIPAQVYTNNANYSEEWGGNGTTTGTFDGAGANNPLPLDQAPPFGPAPRTVRTSRGTGGPGGTFNVNSTSELLALLDGGVVGPDGRITFSNPRIDRNNWRDLSRMDANRLLRAEHQMAIQQMRDRGVTRVGGRLASAQ